MLNKDNIRELAYLVKIDAIEPIIGSDNCECAVVGGWHIMVRKNTFKVGDLAIYFEIDSKVDETNPVFSFLASKHYKIKTQKYTFGGKGNFISQGLLMSPSDFGWRGEVAESNRDCVVNHKTCEVFFLDDESRFLTNKLKVTYSDPNDNKRKSNSDPNAKYKSMAGRHPKAAKTKLWKFLYKSAFGKRILFFFFGKKKDNEKGCPVGKFPGVSKTDQERCENMPWILNDKTPYIVTQKCDGSSGTFILEKKKSGRYEFYVCSRNVRMLKPNQECFYGDKNYYWEVALKYDIENKMKDWMKKNPKATFVCWQGEICAPSIQKNPHHLTDTHLYLFHWTDSINGRIDIREAKKEWDNYLLEVVPIVCDSYIMPNDFEEFKKSADGFYDSDVCEGYRDCLREGFVYYKTTEPAFSFKNVSRNYLLNR